MAVGVAVPGGEGNEVFEADDSLRPLMSGGVRDAEIAPCRGRIRIEGQRQLEGFLRLVAPLQEELDGAEFF